MQTAAVCHFSVARVLRTSQSRRILPRTHVAAQLRKWKGVCSSEEEAVGDYFARKERGMDDCVPPTSTRMAIARSPLVPCIPDGNPG